MQPDKWKAVRAALDQALRIPSDQRDAWVSALRESEPEIADEIEGLLRQDTPEPPSSASPLEAPLSQLFGSAALPEGTRVGAYEIRGLIASGGMGSVYRAERADAEYEKDVAIKLIKRGMDSEEILRRFRRERQVLADLEHSGIARLLDGGVIESGQPFLIMEFVDGRPIDEECDRQMLDIPQRLRLFQQVCHAVHYAHQRLVIHRDIKPNNILVSESGEAKLLDFGVAKVLDTGDDPDQSNLTVGQTFFGTPAFASPEQVRGETVTTASDVYSLGVVLYLLLTGRRPHDLSNKSGVETLHVLSEVNPQRPSDAVSRPAKGDREEPVEEVARLRGLSPGGLRSRLLGDLDNIVLKALRKEPERRYGSPEQLAEDLQRHLDGLPVQARPNTIGYLAGKFLLRNRLPVAIGAALLVSLITGFILVTDYSVRAAEATEQANKRYEDLRGLASSFIFQVSGELDPMDGSLATRERIVRESLEYLDQLAAESNEDPELLHELCRAYLHIGDLQGGLVSANLGRREEAEQSYTKALETAEKLKDSWGEDSRFVALHVISLVRISDSARQRGQVNEALLGYEKALTHCPVECPTEQLSLVKGTCLDRIADIMIEKGEFQRAVQLCREALSIQQELLQKHPGSVPWPKELALAHDKLAKALMRQDEMGLAEFHILEACAILEQVPAGMAGSSQLKQQVVITTFNLGMLYARQERYEDARQPLERAAALVEEVVLADRSDVSARRRLSLTQQLLARVIQSLGNDEEALELHLKSLENKRILIDLDPDNALYKRDLGMSLSLVGGVLAKLGRQDESADLQAQALELFEQLAAQAPESVEARRDLLSTLAGMAGASMNSALQESLHPRERLEHAHRASALFGQARAGLLDLRDENLLAPTDEQFIGKLERFIEDAKALALGLEQQLDTD